MEIEQQADTEAAHDQIGQHLRIVCRSKHGDCFDFNDHLVIDQNVGTEAFIELDALVRDRNSDLPLKGDSGLLQLMTQAALINGFQHARTDDPMYLDGEADDLLGQFARKQHTAFPPCCFVDLRDLRVKIFTLRKSEPRDNVIISPKRRRRIASLSPCCRCHTVFTRPNQTRQSTMSTIDLIDPELRDALAQWSQLPLTAETLAQRRADALALLSSVPTPDLPDIATSEIHVESAFGAKPIRVLTYRPIKSDDPLPVIVHIHGGGFVMGAPEMKDAENRLFASELNCAIYSVDHRLAPEAPHPAPVEDIYSVLVWLHANAGRLGLDPDRNGIKGESGGGGFAAGAALYARDRPGPKFAFQHLIYPMIDDRTAVRKNLHPYVGEFVWTQANNYFGWRSLLGEEPGSAGVSPYAAAARAADVSGLPPTYISVGGLDLFLEENLTYADRLSRAGVPVEFHMYPRAYHGFYRATNARVTKQAEHDTREALRRFLHG